MFAAESAAESAARAHGHPMRREASVFVEPDMVASPSNPEQALQEMTEQGTDADTDERIAALTQSGSWGENRSRLVSKRTFADLTSTGRVSERSGSQSQSGQRTGKSGEVPALLRQLSWFDRGSDSEEDSQDSEQFNYATQFLHPGRPAQLSRRSYSSFLREDFSSSSSDDERDYGVNWGGGHRTRLKDPYQAGVRHRALVLLPDPSLKDEAIFSDIAQAEKARLDEAARKLAEARQEADAAGRGQGAATVGGWFGGGGFFGGMAYAPVPTVPVPDEQGQSNAHVMMIDVSAPYGGRPKRMQAVKHKPRFGRGTRQVRPRPPVELSRILLETANHPLALNALPRDIIVDILVRLPLRDTVSVSAVSNHCHDCANDDVIWLHHLRRDYADFVQENKVRIEKFSDADASSLPRVVSTHFQRTTVRQLYVALSRQYISVLGIPINDVPARPSEISDPEERKQQIARNAANGIKPFFVLHRDIPPSRSSTPVWAEAVDPASIFGECLTKEWGGNSQFEITRVAGSCTVNIPARYSVMWRMFFPQSTLGNNVQCLVGTTFTTTVHSTDKKRVLDKKIFSMSDKHQQTFAVGQRRRSDFVLLTVAQIDVREPATAVSFEMFNDNADALEHGFKIDAIRLYPITDNF